VVKEINGYMATSRLNAHRLLPEDEAELVSGLEACRKAVEDGNSAEAAVLLQAHVVDQGERFGDLLALTGSANPER
jgi:hypothetical protein